MATGYHFLHRHILGIEQLSVEDIGHILDTADSFKEISNRPIKKVPTLRGHTIINLFFEPSTRTRLSFEVAAKRMSADTFNFSPSTSSTTKGETLIDTALNIVAMSADILIVRHASAGVPQLLSRHVRGKTAVINAGDGAHEHPSQGLLDMMTVKEHRGTLAGLKVAIVGDIAHSRVAHSDIVGFTRMGSEVHVYGPATLLPVEIEQLGAKVGKSLEQTVRDADVVIALRIQQERLNDPLLPSLREYARQFGISSSILRLAKPDALVMHPGPVNRGVELSPDVADGRQSLILDQVTNGVAVRMALLYLVRGNTE